MKTLFNWQEEWADTIHVRVTPRAARNRLKLEHLADGIERVRVYVTAPPEDGKANLAVLELLAKEMDLPVSKLTLIRGFKDRDKVIKVEK